MTIKRILLPLPGNGVHAGEIETGLAVTKALGAHIEALFIRSADLDRRHKVGPMTHLTRTAAALPLEFSPQSDPKAEKLQTRFENACAGAGITLSNGGMPGPLTASWRQEEGAYVEVAVRRSAAFDLVIAGSASRTKAAKAIAESELMRTGRPILLAPGHLATKLTDPAMIAWKNRPECWRAVSIALPLLQIAKSVKIVRIGSDHNLGQSAEDELLTYLRCHGIAATAQTVKPNLGTVGDVLLAAAADDDCGLMVMGAYSHGRLRELLRKGTTHHILNHSSARPVLMMH